MEKLFKTCTKCKLEKDLSQFVKIKNKKSYASWCRKCTSAGIKESIKKKPEQYKEYSRKYNETNIFNTMYKNMKKISKKRGWVHPVGMDFLRKVWDLQDGKCYWSNMKMDFVHGMGQNPKSVSIDRLDCNIGYTPENVVLCCHWANMGRSRTPIEKWKEFLKEIKAEGVWSVETHKVQDENN